MINKHKSNKIKENSNTVRHLNNGTDHRHSKSCCDQSSPARRTITVAGKLTDCFTISLHSTLWQAVSLPSGLCKRLPLIFRKLLKFPSFTWSKNTVQFYLQNFIWTDQSNKYSKVVNQGPLLPTWFDEIGACVSNHTQCFIYNLIINPSQNFSSLVLNHS